MPRRTAHPYGRVQVNLGVDVDIRVHLDNISGKTGETFAQIVARLVKAEALRLGLVSNPDDPRIE